MTAPPPWKQLFRIACRHIRQANSERVVIEWAFGGGTAMMLQIDHRESRDIDIFLSDPQQLPFLDPQKQDFEFEIEPDAYEGDGARSLKLVFANIGEIDFIVAPALTSSPDFTASDTSNPGMGDNRKRERSGNCLRGISLASAAARGLKTLRSKVTPPWLSR